MLFNKYWPSLLTAATTFNAVLSVPILLASTSLNTPEYQGPDSAAASKSIQLFWSQDIQEVGTFHTWQFFRGSPGVAVDSCHDKPVHGALDFNAPPEIPEYADGEWRFAVDGHSAKFQGTGGKGASGETGWLHWYDGNGVENGAAVMCFPDARRVVGCGGGDTHTAFAHCDW